MPTDGGYLVVVDPRIRQEFVDCVPDDFTQGCISRAVVIEVILARLTEG